MIIPTQANTMYNETNSRFVNLNCVDQSSKFLKIGHLPFKWREIEHLSLRAIIIISKIKLRVDKLRSIMYKEDC